MFVEGYVSRLKTDMAEFDLIGINNRKISGIGGKEIDYTKLANSENKVYGKGKTVIVIKGEYAYLVEYSAAEQSYDNYLIDMERLIKSIVLLN